MRLNGLAVALAVPLVWVFTPTPLFLVMERGSDFLQMGFEPGYRGLEVGLDVYCLNSDEAHAETFYQFLADFVTAFEFVDFVDGAIDFDGEFQFGTVKVDDELPEGVLAAKLQAKDTAIT